ncbi:hypothetical protein RRG08_065794 [Elysia crispata]|uniref:Uncharacterized protein n=1 Tax=Elysia crispata TaxID=231223 RepID=A0AAE1DLE1_9GAST|nr:hypothetical protein RRG08_065794 [Elysia crispata]
MFIHTFQRKRLVGLSSYRRIPDTAREQKENNKHTKELTITRALKEGKKDGQSGNETGVAVRGNRLREGKKGNTDLPYTV